MIELNQKFNFGVSELSQRAELVKKMVDRDLEHFKERGWPDTTSEDFQVFINNLKEFNTDQYWVGLQTQKTHRRDDIRNQLVELLEDLRLRCKYALGEKSIDYKLFHFSRTSHLKPAEMVTFSHDTVATATNMLEILATRKVDEPLLAAITAKAALLDDSIDEQREGVRIREEKKVERLRAANILYANLVEICDIGKSIWRTENPAYFHDYVIYGSPNSTLEDKES